MHRNDGDDSSRTQTPGNGEDDCGNRRRGARENSNKISDKWIGGELKGEKMSARGGELGGASRQTELASALSSPILLIRHGSKNTAQRMIVHRRRYRERGRERAGQ